MVNQTRSNQHLKYNKSTFFVLSHLRACTYSLAKIIKKPGINVLTILVLAIVLAIPAMFVSMISGIKHNVPAWQQTASINLYLKQNISQTDIASLQKQLQKNMAINQVAIITPQQGLTELTQQLQLPDTLLQLTNNPLPTVLHLMPSQSVNTLQAYQQLTQQLADNPLVDQAQNSFQWSKQLFTILHVLTKLAWIVGIIFALAIIIIISTIMRLTLQQEQAEIQVMQFIGASRTMIMRPLLYQGLWMGVLAGLGAMFIIIILGLILNHPMQQLLSLYQITWSFHTICNSHILLCTWFISCLLTWLTTLISLRF